MAEQAARRGGCIKGQTHSGSFKVGHDDRRSTAGWSNVHKARSIEEQFKVHTAEAIRKLRSLMADDQVPASVQAKAATEILDRAYGKTVDRVAIANVDQSTVTTNVRSLSDKQLLQIALEGVTNIVDTDSIDSMDITVVDDQ